MTNVQWGCGSCTVSRQAERDTDDCNVMQMQRNLFVLGFADMQHGFNPLLKASVWWWQLLCSIAQTVAPMWKFTLTLTLIWSVWKWGSIYIYIYFYQSDWSVLNGGITLSLLRPIWTESSDYPRWKHHKPLRWWMLYYYHTQWGSTLDFQTITLITFCILITRWKSYMGQALLIAVLSKEQ